MTARITFRGEIFIDGKDKEDIQHKFESLEIFSNTALRFCNANFVEVESMEDATTHEGL